MTLADDRFAVIETLDRYAVALDTRDWSRLEYECFGEYRDRLVRTPEGWRIRQRAMRITHETGTRAILKPA